MEAAMRKLLYVAATLALSVNAVQAKSPAPSWPELGVETKLFLGASFRTGIGGNSAIRSYEPDGNDGLWIQDQKRRWYYAKMLGPCNELNFAQAIGFDNRGSAYLDKFTRIYVRGDQCALESFVTAEAPPSKKERKRLAKERRAAEKATKAAR
jgi:Family of unknown function (DUF6491)